MSKLHVTKCEECGYEITMKTKTCLNCGERIGGITESGFKGIMRKIFFILFAIYMLASALWGFWK